MNEKEAIKVEANNLKLPFEQPNSWNEVATNYEAMQRQMRERLEKLAKRFPEKRKEVAAKLEPLKQDLMRIQTSLREVEKEYFKDEDNKVKELGVPGRAFTMGTVFQHLYVAIGELERILDSLRV